LLCWIANCDFAPGLVQDDSERSVVRLRWIGTGKPYWLCQRDLATEPQRDDGERDYAALTFYRDLLGFRITDFMGPPVSLYFMHVNS
jgi:hypothetical protein